MPIKTLIVDDEPHAINILQNYVRRIPELDLVAVCGNAVSAFQLIQKEQVDLLLVDIKMPGLTGTDLVRSLKNPPMVIFTTAYQEYAVEGFNLDAIDYLVKPIPFSRFLRAIDKAMHYIKGSEKLTAISDSGKNNPENPHHFLYLRIDRRTIKLNTLDILWIESVKDYIKVVTPDKIYVTKQKISVAEKLLPFGQFIRIHRSFIAAINKVEAHHPNHVVIKGTKLPVGRNYKADCERQFGAADGMSLNQASYKSSINGPSN